ncbi:MAG: hypothetical protein OT477_21270 [Chloroflexi bacterium]|nr:hypothetical protein [Chloroflexota bacterium]
MCRFRQTAVERPQYDGRVPAGSVPAYQRLESADLSRRCARPLKLRAGAECER